MTKIQDSELDMQFRFIILGFGASNSAGSPNSVSPHYSLVWKYPPFKT